MLNTECKYAKFEHPTKLPKMCAADKLQDSAGWHSTDAVPLQPGRQGGGIASEILMYCTALHSKATSALKSYILLSKFSTA